MLIDIAAAIGIFAAFTSPIIILYGGIWLDGKAVERQIRKKQSE